MKFIEFLVHPMIKEIEKPNGGNIVPIDNLAEINFDRLQYCSRILFMKCGQAVWIFRGF